MNLSAFLYKQGVEAGCDEAGRGCLAGPVFAAAVILSKKFYHPLLNDSKKVSKKDRAELREYLEENALAWSVATVAPKEIDRINILNASLLAMHKAISKLSIRPEFLLIDGNKFHPFEDIPHKCVVKGDSKFASIAAASILAKTYRDDYMESIHDDYPAFGWAENKGYPTLKHRESIKIHGVTEYHRHSFKLYRDRNTQIKLFDK